MAKSIRADEGHSSLPIGTDFSANADPQRHAALLKQLLDSYCDPCFGCLSKREIDILIFQMLLETKQIDISSSQQSISRELRVPISKVKSLVYEAQLRDSQFDQNWFRQGIVAIFQNAQIERSKSTLRIKLAIEDPLLRKELESEVKTLNGFSDYTFNSEILKIDLEMYSQLLKKFVIKPEDQIDLEKAMKRAINKKETELIGWKELLNEFLKSAAGSAGEHTVDLTFGYFTSGASLFVTSLKRILQGAN